MFKKITSILTLVVALVFTAQVAFAALSDVGPVNPQNGFPTWYQDSNGTAVELGLDPALNLFDPPIAGNHFSEQIGFGAEGFYWIAETFVDFPGGQLFYRANLEYAWVNELPANGDQFVFQRLRFRANVPAPGTYTITHPYGVDTFTVDQETFDATLPPGTRAINVTIDVGGATPDFRTALTGRIDPFLTAVNPAAPAGFLGGGVAVLSTVQGSPFGTNFVRIQGPGIDARTDQFMVSGKIFTGQVNTPLTVDRATYTRAHHNAVDVIATSTPNATVSIEGLTPSPASMVGDGTGKFYRHVHLAADAVLPPTITVRADDDPLDPIIQPTGIIKNLVDIVQITKADYDAALRTLTIEAVSGDEVTPPVLSATGFGDLTLGSLVVNDVLVPPALVSVTSSIGGSDTRNVSIVGHTVLANSPPAAANDTANTAVNTAVTINVLANDVDIDGAIAPATLAITVAPGSGTAVKNPDNTITYTPAAGFLGADTFSYTVQDDLGAVSNTATVSINVANVAPAPNIPPVAVPDTATTNANTAVTVDLIANDTDANGINPASVLIVTQPVFGALVNNVNGTVTYTPNNGFSGTDSFTYTVQDNGITPATSNIATVSVSVVPAETVTVTTALFRRIGARWIVSGTGSIPGSVITVRIEGGATVGTGSVSTLGIWSVVLRNSTIIPVAGDTLRVDSTGGAVLRNVPLTIRN